jgi:hypothetical protein
MYIWPEHLIKLQLQHLCNQEVVCTVAVFLIVFVVVVGRKTNSGPVDKLGTVKRFLTHSFDAF